MQQGAVEAAPRKNNRAPNPPWPLNPTSDRVPRGRRRAAAVLLLSRDKLQFLCRKVLSSCTCTDAVTTS